MPIPNNPPFEALLGSFSVSKPQNSEGWREFLAVPKKTQTRDYQFESVSAVTFWYRDDTGVSLEALLKKLAEELNRLGHATTLESVAVLVALFAYSKGQAGSAVDRFNALFSYVVEADANQFFLFPHLELSTYRVEIGPFSIGPFAWERLAYLSRKSGSDFYDRYEEGLRKIPFSVERKRRSVRLVYWHKLIGDAAHWVPRSKQALSTMLYLVDQYFADLSALHFDEFFSELSLVQEVPMALGSGWFDLKWLRQVLGSHQVTIYLKIGGENVGFVSPSSGLIMNINLGGGHLGLPFTGKYLRHKFGFEGFTECEIHRSLQSYCHFLALAAQHRVNGREAEAFLHNVIALDLLLGENGASTASVSSRSAVIAFRAQNQDYRAVVKDLQRIYNARSKYVHEGKQPESSLLPLATRICGEVAFCLFRLQSDPNNRTSGFRSLWLKDLDYLIAALEAGRPVADDDWNRAGVVGGGAATHTAFMAELQEPSSSNDKTL